MVKQNSLLASGKVPVLLPLAHIVMFICRTEMVMVHDSEGVDFITQPI